MKRLKLKRRFIVSPVSRWAGVMLLAIGMQTSFISGLQAASAKRQITDQGITSKVDERLIQEKGVFANDVDISTHKGIVTLSGSVNNILAEDRAVKVAQSIRGVEGVIDQLKVTAVSRPDENIRKDILSALLQDPATTSYQVSVRVKNAKVTLTGSVGSYQEKKLVGRIAKGVKGVQAVKNNVTINYQARHTDPEIKATIQARLKWDIWINGGSVKAAVSNGNVTLTGSVGSALSKTRAYDDAWVDGVKSVNDSALKIDPWLRNPSLRKHKLANRSNKAIKQAVEAAFHLDPRVSTFSPKVTVQSGVVILAGNVGNLKARSSADEDAKNIVGVWRVDNLLKIRPTKQRSDQAMQSELNAALTWDPLLDSATIEAAVINRVAYLSGTVDSSFQKAEAQDVASKIKGIVLVRNHLKINSNFETFNYDQPYYYDWPDYPYHVQPYYNQPSDAYEGSYGPQPLLSDAQIRRNIEDAFFWSPFVDGDNVHVKVDNGVVTLTGHVSSWIGYGEANHDAKNSGATAVRNRISVK